MREILFRGKRLDNGEWVYGDLIQLHDGRKYIVNNRFGACIDDKGNFINTEAPFVNQVNVKTVSQFIGLYDNAGKKIFEGDIISYEDCAPTGGGEYCGDTIGNEGEIVYCDCGWGFTNAVMVCTEDLLYGEDRLNCEVIGNKWNK